MKRIVMLAVCTALTLPLAACSKKDKGTDNPDEAGESQGDPLAELQSIPDQIQAEVDTVMQPINDVDVVVEQITSIPTKYNLDAKALTGMAKASFDGGTVEVSADLNLEAEAKAEVEAMLKTITGIGTGLKETPARAKTATKNIIALGAKATGLVAKLQGKLQATISNPLAKAEKKAEAQAQLQVVTKLDGEIKTIVGETKSTVMELPAKGTEALAKLTAAFSGSAG